MVVERIGVRNEEWTDGHDYFKNSEEENDGESVKNGKNDEFAAFQGDVDFDFVFRISPTTHVQKFWSFELEANQFLKFEEDNKSE